MYYRPGYEHQNVVPYHPTILLLWGAHMNIQRVTNSSMSYYLLKYTMKEETIGTLNISAEAAIKLGLEGLDKIKLQVISAALLTKPISATEAALNCLQIPIISKSEAVHYIDSSPPDIRQHILSGSHNVVMHPVDLYCAMPIALEHLTFFEYHKNHVVQRSAASRKQGPISIDNYRNTVIHQKRLVRFTAYHPGHHTEAFFYNILLCLTSFRSEADLLSPENTASSYFMECQIRNLIQSNEALEMYITEYTQRNMLISDHIDQLVQMIIQKTALRRPNEMQTTTTDNEPNTEHHRLKSLVILKEFASVADSTLTHEQKNIYDRLLNATSGLHIVTGTPGSRKTHLIKCLTYGYVKQDRSVILAASIGAAATRLSSIASTVHYQFKIPTRNQLYPLSIHETDDRYIDIKDADVIIINELSMLTKTTFGLVVRQIVNVTGGGLTDPFFEKCHLAWRPRATTPDELNIVFIFSCSLFAEFSTLFSIFTVDKMSNTKRLFDLFKKNIAAKKQPTIEEQVYLSDKQIVLVNLAGCRPEAYIKGFKNYPELRAVMDTYAEKSKEDKSMGIRRATGRLTKEIIIKLGMQVDVPEEHMTAEDANRLVQTKTSVKAYILEMLQYAYNIDVEDVIDMSNNDANEILVNFKQECNEITQSITSQKVTWQHDKEVYEKRFKHFDPYGYIDKQSQSIEQDNKKHILQLEQETTNNKRQRTTDTQYTQSHAAGTVADT
ncbi:hypothetical protein L7F22_031224 [Adiantum nelumboides]|nr:hypothetical protein [Adiantum nelumboides]